MLDKQEKMTAIERINALLSSQPVDRVPVWLWLISAPFAAKNVGYTVASSYIDVDMSFWSQVWTQEMYGSDDIPRPSIGGTVKTTWAFGGEIKLPHGEYSQAPLAVRYPLESGEDARKLEPPEDITQLGPIPLLMQFARMQQEHGFPITVPCESPVEAVRGICGMEMLCRWMIKSPEVVHRLLRLATDFQLKVAQYWVETFGPDRLMVQNTAPTTSNQVISPRQFEAFFLPYQKELHEKILAMGVRHIFCHICGDQNLNLPYWAQVPMGNPGIVSFGHEISLATAIEYFGDTSIIAGNIEPVVIQMGTPQQVYELCRQCIEDGKNAPRGYILTPGCGLPPMAPPYNVYMMVKAARDSGWYD
ncbi:uroporphyrinogen decarboxylase family protein [Bacteroidota bacterium]